MTRPIDRLLEIMDRLRDPRQGCPWDLEQDFRSIVPHTLEEAYEVAETVECGELGALRDELGDLLFQVVFLARLGKERGLFEFDDVATAIADKLVRRHPHVFGDADAGDAAAQSVEWESIKAGERAGHGATGALDGVPLSLPALQRASRLGKRAARVGFDWPGLAGVLDKVGEERRELDEAIEGGDADRIEAELGDLLFAFTNLARHLGVDAERGLRGTNRRFEKRFRAMESALAAGGRDLREMTIEEMETCWQAAKRG